MLPDDLSLFKSGGIKPPQLVKHLPPGFSVVQNQETVLQGKLRDTFDACCRRAGVVLLQQKNRVSWIHLKSGRMEEQAVSGDWSFAGELKGGPVGFQCLELSGLRAFSDLEALEVRSAEWAVTDELEKTVVRFRSIHLRRGPKLASWIFLQPLRGYDDDALRVFQALDKYGFRRGGTDYFPLIGLDAPLYEAKPPMDLRAASPAIETAGRIIENCIVTARRNEPGILDDIDTEFLHDYRVCLRRARSVLSLFRGVYAAGFCDAAKQQLADVMKQTNRLRDLDVYLLDRHAYYDMVPESQFGGLDIMFGIFEAERGEALEGVRAAITQPDYERGLDNLLANFQTLEKKNHGPAAQDPTGVFAKRLILKRYGKIASIAAVIDAATPENEVHELRIQCKKLRYLMEFFMPLFPAGRIKPMIRSLKGLQDVLGRFNDYCVQRAALASFAQTHPMRGRKGLQVAESVGALVATLFQLQKKARGDVEADLKLFVNRKTSAAFRVLFSTE